MEQRGHQRRIGPQVLNTHTRTNWITLFLITGCMEPWRDVASGCAAGQESGGADASRRCTLQAQRHPTPSPEASYLLAGPQDIG